MPNFRRWYQEGGTWFFTVVTCQRQPLFKNAPASQRLGNCIRSEQSTNRFENIAIVLLPDHLHCVWQLPRGDSDFSNRWKRIKSQFSREWIRHGGQEANISDKAATRGQRGIWQSRFWEHMIRDQQDLKNHCDYIHYNPVKHGYVDAPKDWTSSSFQRFVKTGEYEMDWGRSEPENITNLNLE